MESLTAPSNSELAPTSPRNSRPISPRTENVCMTEKSAPARVSVTQGEHQSKKIEPTNAPGSDWKLMKLHFKHTDVLYNQVTMIYRKRGSLVSLTEQILPLYEQLLQNNHIDYKIGSTYMSRCTKYAIKGISPVAIGKSIQHDLKHLGFKVLHMSNMTLWETKKPLLMFLTVLEDTPGHEDILGL